MLDCVCLSLNGCALWQARICKPNVGSIPLLPRFSPCSLCLCGERALARWPGKVAAGQQVQMNVVDRLPRIAVTVHRQAVTVFSKA